MNNTRVVLRRLTSAQAQRRGKRAIEVCGLFIVISVLFLKVPDLCNYFYFLDFFLGIEEASSP